MITVINNEDAELIEKFVNIKNRGLYADGKQLTDVYNRVLNKNLNPTNCGSCIRQRISELETALNQYKAWLAKQQITPEETQQQPETKKITKKKAK